MDGHLSLTTLPFRWCSTTGGCNEDVRVSGHPALLVDMRLGVNESLAEACVSPDSQHVSVSVSECPLMTSRRPTKEQARS